MPLPVSLDHLDTTKLIRRAEFGLDSDRFYFLFMFDSNSRVHRKNPIACLRAFQKAFPDLDEKVGVVVKSMNLKPDSSDSIELLNQAGSDPRIKIFSEIFDRQRTIDLMRACDAFLSLHRSEGFGRGLAEAMLLERPAIGTGFSGNLEFMNEENSYLVSYKTIPVGEDEYFYPQGQVWANPDVEDAAIKMRECFANLIKRTAKIVAAKRNMIDHHSIESVSKAIQRRFHESGFEFHSTN
jgi:glycosyltransferase involved in cell wall biosynthesis